MIRIVRHLVVALVVAVHGAMALAGIATGAEEPKRLWQEGENCGDLSKLVKGECGFEVGPGFFETLIPRGIATNPASGHVFIADQGNSRVVELDAWGQFVKAWGWGVRDGSAELQSCTVATGCQKGLAGSGAGQFETPRGVAVDSQGDVYVADRENVRVQKFDPDGGPEGKSKFLLMLGGDVNRTKVEAAAPEADRNRCPVDPGDACQAGVAGAGNGEFDWMSTSSLIAIGEDDALYVGDSERIQKLDPDGAYLESLSLPGESVHSLAVDPFGNLYTSFTESVSGPKPGVRKLDPSGAPICTAFGSDPEATVTDSPTAVAANPAGGFYVFDAGRPGLVQPPKVIRFGPNCEEVESFEPAEFVTPEGFNVSSTGLAASVVTDAGESALYISAPNNDRGFIRAYYPAPEKFFPPPLAPPDITDQYASSVETETAAVRAIINPHFWDDTTYFVEFGTGKCSEGGCDRSALAPGASLGAGIVDEPVTSPPAILTGLSPDTTYHYRFIAESSGGGPVQSAEASFTTFPLPAGSNVDCPNQALRSGASASLPDCRAYELVTPLEKGNDDVIPPYNGILPARIDQATPAGEKFTYSAAQSFANPEGAPWSSQYIATRHEEDGWSSENVSPPREGITFYQGDAKSRDVPFKVFSEDLCDTWLVQDVEAQLAPEAIEGYANLYQRENCAGGYLTLSTAAPLAPTPEAKLYGFGVQGFDADRTITVFRANARLTADASSAEIQLYASTPEGDLRLLSILPDGTAATANSSAGTGYPSSLTNITNFRYDTVRHAVSEDAKRVYWSTEGGQLYLRTNPLESQSAISGGKCTEAAKACTVRVSGLVATQKAQFWQARPDGSEVLFGIVQGGEETLYEYNAKTGKASSIASKVEGVMGASEDLSRVYLVSKAVLGDGAQVGDFNLYRYEAGAGGGFHFIAALSELDVIGTAVELPVLTSPIDPRPSQHSARVSADGLHLAFESRAEGLTDYDNTDAASGEPDAEVYLYDASANGDEGQLVCVSCNPTGARPTGSLGGAACVSFGTVEGGKVCPWAAARLPGWETQLYPTRALSANGNRLFFDSHDALVLADTNGRKDVYEWEAAGEGDCTAADPTFTPDRAGCVRLISSGESSVDSEFRDASADGSDVFFTTGASLVSRDPGLIDIYDARVGGGFAEPDPPAGCEGEACQGPPAAPNDPTPASSSFQGAGNVAESHPPSRCAKGKVRRRGRCVARKQRKRASKAKQRADRKRRAGR